jgi:hypothetical protein
MSGETEEMSAFSGIEYDPNVIWSDDPENAYFRQMVGDRDGNNTDSLIGDSTLADLEDGQTLPTYDRPIVQLQGSTGLSLGEDTIDNITPASAAVKNRSFGWFTARGNGQGHEKSSPGSLTKGKSPVSALSSKFGGEIAETNPPDHSFVDVNLDLENVNVPNTIFLGERPSADTTSGTTKRSKSKKDSDQATPSQTTKRCIRLIILFLTLSVVASITVLVLTLTNTSSKDKGSALSNDELPNDDPDFEFPNTLTEGPTPTNPAPSPIAISTSAPAPTPAPTVPSTLAPAVNPTPAPVPTLPFNPLPTVLTGGTTSPVLVPGPSSKDILMEDVSNQIVQLSPRSLDALQTAGSPQYRALEWVVNEQIASSLQNNRALVANSTATNNDVVDSKILQRWILSTFYYSTEGDQWDESGDWLNATDECSWTNVDCTSGNGDDDHDRVEKLYLSGNNLAGELPLELSLLSSSLVYLPLNSNDIGGTIPTEFGLLTKLGKHYY